MAVDSVTTMPAIRQMLDLQAVDLEIQRHSERLAEIAKRLGNERPLAKYRNEAADLQESVRKITSRQRELDAVAAELTGRIEGAEKKLYGGTVTSPRELRDLEADVTQLKRQRSGHEGELLEVMDTLEAEQAKLAAATKLLARAEKVWKTDQEQMAGEQGTLQAELTSLTHDRNAKAAALTPLELALYEQVRKGHGGRAVAEVRNGMCQSCRVALPTRQAQSIKTSATPVRCPSCGLILLAE
ncbi:MAG: hypothetical protein WD645_02215 [Dehalococcoidia bacterium]